MLGLGKRSCMSVAKEVGGEEENEAACAGVEGEVEEGVIEA